MASLKTKILNRARTALQPRGFDITPVPHPDSLGWSIRHTLRELSVRHVLDVGAHHGQFVGRLRSQAGYAGAVTSFECAPRALSVLLPTAAADPNWTVQQVALGDETGEATFTDYEVGELSSLRPITSFARSDWNFEAGTEITVPVRRLDDVMPTTSGPVFLKIDTQGHDLAVLAGASASMPLVSALLMEMPVQALYQGTLTFEAQVAHVRDLGFDPVGFWPVQRLSASGRSTDSLRVVEFDGLFVRRP